MKTAKLFGIILTALLLTACSKKKSFSIQGEIQGIGAQTVTATYYADGGLKRASVPATDNVFVISGSSKKPTLVTLALSDGTQIATLILSNGDKAKLKGDINAPYSIEVSANGDSEKIADWINDNAELLQSRNAAAINSAVAQWVGDNRSSKAATALMLTYFQTDGYEHMADSLMSLLSGDARAQEIVQNFTGVLSSQLGGSATAEVPILYLFASSDSVIAFNPRSQKALLLCFMPESRGPRDSVGSQLRQLTAAYPAARFRAVEISTAPDSAAWRNSISGDSATWKQTWAPATIASTSIRKLAVPRTPYFIVADSAGSQIYRGSSITAARRVVENRLK